MSTLWNSITRVGGRRAFIVALVGNLVVSCALMPVAGQPFDLAGLTGASESFMRWGVPIFSHWKFGADLTAIGLGSQCLAFVLRHLGISGAAALAIAWKLPLIVANVVSAQLLRCIGLRLGSPRATLVSILWLLSPVPIFVAAGFGQVEPLACVTVLMGVWSLLSRRYLTFGLVVGLGVGFEYVPGIVAVVGIAALIGSRCSPIQILRSAGGFLGGVGLSFGPVVISNVGRQALIGGLSSSAGSASGVRSGSGARVASIWSFLGGLRPGHLWVAAAGAAILLLVIAYWVRLRSVSDGTEADRLFCQTTALVLLVVLLADPNPLPQFSLLSLMALSLLALSRSVSLAAIAVGASSQLAAGLVWVYGGSFQSFWYDMWSSTGNSGWAFPSSARWSTGLSFFGCGLITAAIVISLAWPSLAEFGNGRQVVLSAGVLSALGSCFLGLWSLQPVFWLGVASSGPSDLPVFVQENMHLQLAVRFSGRGWVIRRTASFPKIDSLALSESVESARVSLRSFKLPSGVGHPVRFGGVIQIPSVGKRAGEELRSIWLSVVVGDSQWTVASKITSGIPKVESNGVLISPAQIEWLIPGWAELSYKISVGALTPSPSFPVFVVNPSSVVINGGAKGPWVLVAPAGFTLPVNGSATASLVSAVSDPPTSSDPGVVRASIGPLSPEPEITLPAVPGLSVLSASLALPARLDVTAAGGAIVIWCSGLTYGGLVLVGGFICGRRIRR